MNRTQEISISVLISILLFTAFIFIKNTFIEPITKINVEQRYYEKEYFDKDKNICRKKEYKEEVDKDKNICRKKEYKEEVDENYFIKQEKRQYIKCMNNEIFKIGFYEIKEELDSNFEILNKCEKYF